MTEIQFCHKRKMRLGYARQSPNWTLDRQRPMIEGCERIYEDERRKKVDDLPMRREMLRALVA